MAETSQAADTRAEFADIICADAEWVRAEFAQIVSVLARVRTAIAAPRFRTEGDRRLWHLTTPARILRPQTLPERVRAPPPGDGRSAAFTVDEHHSDGMSQPSLIGRRLFHHVDVV